LPQPGTAGLALARDAASQYPDQVGLRWVVVLAACGGAQEQSIVDTGVADIATPQGRRLRVKVDGATPLDTNGLRATLAWWGDGLDATRRPLVFQDLRVISMTNTWPIELELAVEESPPSGAIHYALGYRQAKLVVYRDDNANSVLDFTPVLADAFVDQIVAFHPDVYVWYYDNGDFRLALPGAVDQVELSTPFTVFERSMQVESCAALDWTPHRTLFTARNPYSDPSQRGPWDAEAVMPVACPNNEPPPDTRAVWCDTNYAFRASWSTPTSTFVSEKCGSVFRTCQARRSDLSGPPTWPCPCDPSKWACVQTMFDL